MVYSLLRRVCVALPGDAGAGGDASDAAGAGPRAEAQGGRRRGLEKGGKNFIAYLIWIFGALRFIPASLVWVTAQVSSLQ